MLQIVRRPALTVLLGIVALVALLAAACGGGGSDSLASDPTSQPSPTLPPSPVATPLVVPAPTPTPQATPDPPEDAEPDANPESPSAEQVERLAEEMQQLVALASEWDSEARAAVAVVLWDGSLHGVNASEIRPSASSVKPLWTAAAIETAGLAAVGEWATPTLRDSENYAAGKMIDLAGGIDTVNAWIGAAGLRNTRQHAWRFGAERVAARSAPPGLHGNVTSASDLALFYARLHLGELLDEAGTAALRGWLQGTSRDLNNTWDVDGALLDRLPAEAAATALRKAGWLPPGCCTLNARLLIDAGWVQLPGGDWYSVAIISDQGDRYELTVQWVALASCRVYAVLSGDTELVCEQPGDGVPNSQRWPVPTATPTPSEDPTGTTDTDTPDTDTADADTPDTDTADPTPTTTATAEVTPTPITAPTPEVTPTPATTPEPTPTPATTPEPTPTPTLDP